MAWYHELDAALIARVAPLSSAPHDAGLLDPLALRERVQAQRPDAIAYFVNFLEPRQVAQRHRLIFIQARPGEPPLASDELVSCPVSNWH